MSQEKLKIAKVKAKKIVDEAKEKAKERVDKRESQGGRDCKEGER